MKYALFIGCNIPARVEQYEIATRAVLNRLDVELVDIRGFGCCGYPIRNRDQKAFLLASAYNLALAEQEGLDILALCKCCFGSLKKAENMLKEDGNLRIEINKILSENDVYYKGDVQVKHLLSVLYHDVGIESIKSKKTREYKELNIATHYGCHALRPSEITRFDDPVAPLIFDKLVEVTGSRSIDWETRLECCGGPVMGINDDLSMNIVQKKIKDAEHNGADYVCTACPWCHQQFDTVQKMALSNDPNGNNNGKYIGTILYPQLLGLTMGIDKSALGLNKNEIDISAITSFLSEE